IIAVLFGLFLCGHLSGYTTSYPNCASVPARSCSEGRIQFRVPAAYDHECFVCNEPEEKEFVLKEAAIVAREKLISISIKNIFVSFFIYLLLLITLSKGFSWIFLYFIEEEQECLED